MFEVYAMGNTAQLDFCGGYELSQFFPTLQMLSVWPENHFGVVYPKKKVKIREISVYFDYFWSICDGLHCSVGLLWEIWIEPSLRKTPMLSVWPENHFGIVYLQKMVKIWTISVHFDRFWSSCDGKHRSVGLLWGLIESFQHHMLLVWLENHMGVVCPKRKW